MLIEVVTYSRSDRAVRDRAECDTPDEAIVAARSLLHDASDAGCGSPRAAFYVDGKLARRDVTMPSLSYVFPKEA